MIKKDTRKHNKYYRRSKCGFTLLETVLAVALLLIITAFIYQGFMSTIHYSTNTAVYQRSGEYNERFVKGMLHDFSTHMEVYEGLYIEDASGLNDKVLTIHRITGDVSFDTLDAISEFSERSDEPIRRRHGLAYIERRCPDPDCDAPLRWYQHENGNIYEMCMDPDCGYYDGPS